MKVFGVFQRSSVFTDKGLVVSLNIDKLFDSKEKAEEYAANNKPKLDCYTHGVDMEIRELEVE